MRRKGLRPCFVALLAGLALPSCMAPEEEVVPPDPATVPDLLEQYALAVSSRTPEAYVELHLPESEFRRAVPCDVLPGDDLPWVPTEVCLPWLDNLYWTEHSALSTCWGGSLTLDLEMLDEVASDSGRAVTVEMRVRYGPADGRRLEVTEARFDVVELPEGWRIRGIEELPEQRCR